jgi:hypothetical protein
MFRRIRIALLLLILVIVALNAWTDRLNTTNWNAPMTVALFPINADGSAATEQYIAKLTEQDFAPLEAFFQTEIAEAGIKLDRPLRFTLAPRLTSVPPTLSRDSHVLRIMLWSLQLRWWAWRVPPKAPGPTPRIRMFLPYYDPARTSVLTHSTGLQKGLIGIAQLFADPQQTGANQVVIAHELLHTLGATDKYDYANNQPQYPDGFAEPALEPRYPQRYAELMAGRIPLSTREARIPNSLQEALIGPATASEIGWRKQ